MSRVPYNLVPAKLPSITRVAKPGRMLIGGQLPSPTAVGGGGHPVMGGVLLPGSGNSPTPTDPIAWEPANLDLLHNRVQSVCKVVNGNIEFGSPSEGPVNIGGNWQESTTPSTANQEFTINHNLGYIPSGFLVFSTDQPSHIYASRKNQWTNNQIFLKCDTASVAFTAFVA